MFTFVLPQSVVRTMGYKDVKSLHRAMIVGTVIIGAMMIGVTALGVLAAGVLTEDLAAYGGSVDNIIPLAISRTLPPVLAGIAIIGPVAASISTVSSLLISSSSALVKDVWMHYAEARGRRMGERALSVSSQAVTLGLGAVVFVLAVVPPDVIWKINMFAFGGLETAVVDGGRYAGVLRNDGARLQSGRSASDRHRHRRGWRVHGRRLAGRQAGAGQPHGGVLP